ncbi:MAG TPA: MFS transporter [Acidimicrobiales bacterium]|nr:MFS transporter [Acidimicrobiales bacterium]
MRAGGPAVGRAMFRSLQNRNFKLYTSGQLVSVVGTGMQQVAQAWLVLSLTNSGVALGITVALQFAPMLLFGIWGGLMADRLDKRRLLIFTQAAQGVLALMLFALVATDVVTLGMVYGMALLLGLVTCLDMPTRQSFTIEMVGPDLLTNAVALNSAVFNSGRLVGPAVAGLLIASVGVDVCFLVNGLSYVATVVALRAMRPEELSRQPRAPRERGQVRAGLRYVWGTPELRRPLLLLTVVGTLGFNFIVVLPLLATKDFGGGARLLGVLNSLMGLGSLMGALVAANRARPTRPVLLGGAAAFGLAATAMAVAPNAVVAGVLAWAMGMSMMIFLATTNSTLQLAADSAMRGRVMALYGLLFLGSTPVGGPIVGWVSETWGARAGIALGGVASLVAAGASALPGLRRRWATLSGRRAGAVPALAGDGPPMPLAPAPGAGDPVEAV